MKIYTKKGDSGTTGLIGGTRVAKNNIRIDAYGTIDELNSYMGLLRDISREEAEVQILIHIQDRLFTLGSLLAADPEKSRMKLPQIHLEDITILEGEIDKMESTLPEMKSFILPGGHIHVSHCHIARCVCRRAERKVVTLAEQATVEPLIIQYLNRLSDYLFVLSRKWSMDLKANEIPWIPKNED